MGKKFTIVAVTAVALLLAGIVWAVVRLYNTPQDMPREHMAVSLHNSGTLVPLVAVQMAQPDSLLLDQAARAGLKY